MRSGRPSPLMSASSLSSRSSRGESLLVLVDAQPRPPESPSETPVCESSPESAEPVSPLLELLRFRWPLAGTISCEVLASPLESALISAAVPPPSRVLLVELSSRILSESLESEVEVLSNPPRAVVYCTPPLPMMSGNSSPFMSKKSRMPSLVPQAKDPPTSPPRPPAIASASVRLNRVTARAPSRSPAPGRPMLSGPIRELLAPTAEPKILSFDPRHWRTSVPVASSIPTNGA